MRWRLGSGRQRIQRRRRGQRVRVRPTTTLADGAKFSERILGVDSEHRRVAYTIQDSPFPIEFHAASMQVFDAGAGKSTADVKPDEFAEALTGLMGAETARIKARY